MKVEAVDVVALVGGLALASLFFRQQSRLTVSDSSLTWALTTTGCLVTSAFSATNVAVWVLVAGGWLMIGDKLTNKQQVLVSVFIIAVCVATLRLAARIRSKRIENG